MTRRGKSWLAGNETDRSQVLLLDRTGTAGNLTSDAHLAALAISLGATLVSCDADLGRFPALRWVNPAG